MALIILSKIGLSRPFRAPERIPKPERISEGGEESTRFVLTTNVIIGLSIDIQGDIVIQKVKEKLRQAGVKFNWLGAHSASRSTSASASAERRAGRVARNT